MSQPSHPIYHLRNSNLDPELALRLEPFIRAHRPHSDIPTKEELGERLPLESPCGMKQLAEDIGRKYIPRKKRQSKGEGM